MLTCFFGAHIGGKFSKKNIDSDFWFDNGIDRLKRTQLAVVVRLSTFVCSNRLRSYCSPPKWLFRIS